MTNLIMTFIVLFLAATLLINAKRKSESSHFFNFQNSNTLRGFWSLVVVLVHIPLAYQNRIQDIIGSFAYIGVTFFFMTSAYGLRISVEKSPASIKFFWRRRLPKLLIPCLLANIVQILFLAAEGKDISVLMLVNISLWVEWLLVCYLIFWICQKYIGSFVGDLIICIVVIGFSLTVYAFRDLIKNVTWCTEVFGFVWGIALFHKKDKFAAWMSKSWISKSLVLCLVAGVLGVLYLKFKFISFWGDYALKILLGAAITAFMLALNTRIEIGNRISSFLGRISFEVYLLHGIVFDVIESIAPNMASGVFILTSLVLTIFLSAWLQRLGCWIMNRIQQRQMIGS